MSFNIRKKALGLTVLFLIVTGIQMGRDLFIASPWIGYLYTTADNGLDRKIVGDFKTLDECKAVATTQLQSNPKLSEGGIANRFMCGLKCYTDAPFGSVFISEIACDERFESSESMAVGRVRQESNAQLLSANQVDL